MKIKKIVALILTCALTISPLNSFAFAENDSTLTAAKIKEWIKENKNFSKAKIKGLEEQTEKLLEDNEELKEKVENLQENIEKLKNKNNTLSKELEEFKKCAIEESECLRNLIGDFTQYVFKMFKLARACFIFFDIALIILYIDNLAKDGFVKHFVG